MKLFKLNSKLIVAAAALASCAAVGAAPVAPTAGAQCAPADWGRDSPLFVQPALTCVHGTWMETSTLSSIAFSVSGVDKDGKEFLSYFQDVREGKANAIGQWTEQGVPVHDSNGSLRTEMRRFGDGGTLTLTLTSDKKAVRVEGTVIHSDPQTSWQQPVNVTVPLDQDAVMAARPGGVIYKIHASVASN